jgi:UDP-N-acetylglucosamine--N-acetylmuramyl-(pentapeptide) pyrophosphoryl-undecaprenol N-acetylglucosamine transferase
VISRAGANALCELLALKKPNLLIPLPATVSRGDQLLNAASFEAQGFSVVLQEEEITPELLTAKVAELYASAGTYIEAMQNSGQMDSVSTILSLIEEVQVSS